MTQSRQNRSRILARTTSGIASYQGRYLALALAVSVLLMSFAWLGYQTVDQSTKQQIQRMEVRANREKLLGDIQQRLQDIAIWLSHQVIQPGIHQPNPPNTKILPLELEIAQLNAGSYIPDDPQKRLIQSLLEHDLPKLNLDIKNFLKVSHKNTLRFPSTRIMETRMRPLAINITDVFNHLIAEVNEQQKDWTLFARLLSARHLWQQVLSEFRLLVANRFGVFSDDPESGMRTRSNNIQLYFNQLLQELRDLQNMRATSELFAVSEHPLQLLEQKIQSWYQHYAILLKNLYSENWRQDLKLYRSTLIPDLNNIQFKLNRFKQYLREQEASDIRSMTATAAQLTQTIAVLAATIALLILSGYLYLRNAVLKPIALTTQALRAEALSEAHAPLPKPKLKETRDLVDAFNEMQAQIIKRQKGLDHLAHHDPLTQLPNRMLFKDRMNHALEIARRSRQCVALLFLDLDNFKQVNDTMGHRAGDNLLIDVAKRLRTTLRDADTVARLGGDEFAILLENIKQEAEACAVADKVLQCFQSPFLIGEHEFHVSCSIGIAAAPCNAPYSDDLIRDADTAMYEAKGRGKNSYHCYSSKLFDRATNLLTLERDLRMAISQYQLIFHYQPIVHAKTNELMELEALLRWQLPSGELRMPGEFLSCLLGLKQEHELNRMLLQQVGDMQSRFLDEYGMALHVALNMAPCTLRNRPRHKKFIEAIKSMPHPQLIGIEITEDTLVEDINGALSFLQALKTLGSPLSLDDFGTGQSSLNHLRYFPFDRIKIDREFVANLPSNHEDAALVRAIIQLAHNFDMEVVGEGVETPAQRQFLIDAGCDYLQGYLISPPVPENELPRLIQSLGRVEESV